MAAAGHAGCDAADGRTGREHRGVPGQHGVIAVVANFPRRPGGAGSSAAGDGDRRGPGAGRHRGGGEATDGRCGEVVPDQ